MDELNFQLMLNRDQRTAKNFIYHKTTTVMTKEDDELRLCRTTNMCDQQELQDEDCLRTSNDVANNNPSVAKRRKNRNKGQFMWHHQHNFQRLKHALLFGTYLCLVTLPSIIAAPLNMSSRTNSRPWWINPIGLCNGGATSQVPTKDLLGNIVNQSKLALNRAEKTASTFVKETFNDDSIGNIHSMFNATDYDWLPTKHLPKQLNKSIHDPEYLESLKLDQALIETYNHMQKIAVGIEQMSWDQEDRKGPLRNLLNATCADLRLVLSEIQTTICESNLTIPENIDRDIMGPEYRQMTDMTDINIRDWVIFRDYMNMLEYIIEVFTYLEQYTN